MSKTVSEIMGEITSITTSERIARVRKANKKRTLYLAYGSNLNVQQMASRCPTAQKIGSSLLPNYRLTFVGGFCSAVANIERKKGSGVPVGLWSITKADEASLDRYEGYPTFYHKEYHFIQLNGKKRLAMVYVMNRPVPYGTPSAPYYNTIWKGYEDFCLDQTVLKVALEEGSCLERRTDE